ncbi:hypothetical protein L2E82_49921 [Cichorium intybus]|uniref:Uncharacterized protein n=2 Tax=Cichorium intybus TaxID=13427 RepID=A0ACB8Z2G4_CICIN|nr:hypothetical protein L2E82_49920 [Cichorium intybus]KAI3691556.1 hypothetical protein L2E82_49921 [Cichorium intybus]
MAKITMTMMNSLLSLVLVFLVVSSTVIAGSDSPFIVAHKKATLNKLKSGAEKVSVSIDIYNQGSTEMAKITMTMMNSLLSLVLVFLVVSSTVIAGSDSPFIVAHKKATLNKLKSGAEKVSVSIDIYNQGSAEMAKITMTMMNSLLSLVLVFLVVSSTVIAGSDSPFIVAHKKATLNKLKSGAEKVSVSIDIYNQGSTYVASTFFFSYLLFCM